MERSDGKNLDCAAWMHTARSLPAISSNARSDQHLTGKDTEPTEIVCFKFYQRQIPVIEQETAALMLGTDKSRGHRLEMICADLLAGAHLDKRPGDPAPLALTLLQVIARRTTAGVPRKPQREGDLRMIHLKASRLRLDPLSYETLRQRVLRRDAWRCQSCGTM